MSTAVIILILCIIINSLIGVVFKLFSRYEVNIFYAIMINYIVCVITGSLYLGHMPLAVSSINEKWFPYAVILGFIFVTVFTIYGNSVKHFGIVVSTIFQKMSMLAPAIIAIMLYGENLNLLKGLGIALGILSIIFLSYQKSEKSEEKNSIASKKYWAIPIAVFLGSCIIDSTLFLMEEEKIAPSGDISFVIHLFFFAFVAGLVLLLIQLAKGKRERLERKDIIAGICLGIPNFFSIYLLLEVIASGWDASVVFPINNVGILSCSAILGFLLFKERITKNKVIGLAMAIIAIVLISY